MSDQTEFERQFQANLQASLSPVQLQPISLNGAITNKHVPQEAQQQPDDKQAALKQAKQPQQPQQQPPTSYEDYFKEVTSFHVVQELEPFVDWQEANKHYTIRDQNGREVFRAGQLSDCCSRQFCWLNGAFSVHFRDLNNRHIMTLDKHLSCSWFCGYFCRDNLLVTTPMGQLIGSIEENFHILYPRFNLRNSAGQSVLRVDGACCGCSGATCWREAVYELVTPDGATKMGEISKHWSGYARELLTDAHQFQVDFPRDLPAPMKATCLAALFLIDFMYFQCS